MNAKFAGMTCRELRAQILQHRADNKAFYAYMDKSAAEGNWIKMQAIKSIDEIEKYPDFIEKLPRENLEQLSQKLIKQHYQLLFQLYSL